VVVNHLSLIDPPLVGLSLKRQALFMAKEELFRSRLGGAFLKGVGVFPVSRGRLDMTAQRKAMAVLESGRALVIFPEGRRGKHLNQAYPGAALIASRHDVPVLPVGITGTEQLKGIGWLFRRPEITISIGAPFRLPAANGHSRREQLTENTAIIMKQIARQLPRGYHGHYGGEKE
jgi:1-acyl-sn-glycerol-3-phosphate acyltransferase